MISIVEVGVGMNGHSYKFYKSMSRNLALKVAWVAWQANLAGSRLVGQSLPIQGHAWLYWENHRRTRSKWRQINKIVVMLMVVCGPGYTHYVLSSLWCSACFICFLSPTWSTTVDRKLVFNKDLLESNLKRRPFQVSTMASRLWERTWLQLQKKMNVKLRQLGSQKSIYFISWKLSHVYFIHKGILDNCLIHSKALKNNPNHMCDILSYVWYSGIFKIALKYIIFLFLCVGRLFNII